MSNESIFCCKSTNIFVAINTKISDILSSASVTSPLSVFSCDSINKLNINKNLCSSFSVILIS